MDDKFIAIIEADIKKGHEIVDNKNRAECNDFHTRILSKYAPIIEGFDKNLHYLMYDSDKSCCLANIKIMVVIQFPIYCYDREFDIMLDSRDKEKAEQIMDIAYNEWVNNPEQLGDWCLEEYISHRLECDDIDFDFVPAE